MQNQEIAGCRNDSDPFTLDDFEDLEPSRIINIDGDCFDLKALFNWIYNQEKFKNPLTNLPFSEAALTKIKITALDRFPTLITVLTGSTTSVANVFTFRTTGLSSFERMFINVMKTLYPNENITTIYEAIKISVNQKKLIFSVSYNDESLLLSTILKREHENEENPIIAEDISFVYLDLNDEETSANYVEELKEVLRLKGKNTDLIYNRRRPVSGQDAGSIRGSTLMRIEEARRLALGLERGMNQRARLIDDLRVVSNNPQTSREVQSLNERIRIEEQSSLDRDREQYDMITRQIRELEERLRSTQGNNQRPNRSRPLADPEDIESIIRRGEASIARRRSQIEQMRRRLNTSQSASEIDSLQNRILTEERSLIQEIQVVNAYRRGLEDIQGRIDSRQANNQRLNDEATVDRTLTAAPVFQVMTELKLELGAIAPSRIDLGQQQRNTLSEFTIEYVYSSNHTNTDTLKDLITRLYESFKNTWRVIFDREFTRINDVIIDFSLHQLPFIFERMRSWNSNTPLIELFEIQRNGQDIFPIKIKIGNRGDVGPGKIKIASFLPTTPNPNPPARIQPVTPVSPRTPPRSTQSEQFLPPLNLYFSPIPQSSNNNNLDSPGSSPRSPGNRMFFNGPSN